MSSKNTRSLPARFPPSPPCSCEICISFCARPGWWTVSEAAGVIRAGYARRMMLEMSPDFSFGVLSPAFKGNECDFARQRCARYGCTFLTQASHCELYGTGFQPLECRFCHHERLGRGPACHNALAHDWQTPAARSLIVSWAKITGLWEKVASWNSP